jgi:thymidine kinase
MSGSIELIIGPMFSGKTTFLINRINRYTYSKKKCVLIKYLGDTRYSNEFAATHDKIFHKAISATMLSFDLYLDYDVIGIDEGQFFPDILQFSEKMADNGKVVIISCLNADYLRKGFENVLKLVPISETITKLSAVCVNCGKDASFTKRLTDEKETEIIGGTDKYTALCRLCFNQALSLSLCKI